ncbi:MAG: sulfatase-like hydrolase/transferase, partial [Erysipelotrichaceae bacterium]
MKKNIIRFNKVIYSKNINQSLYFFFLKKEFRLIKYLPLRLLVSILFMLHLYNEQNYMKIQYKYLKDIISLDNKLVIYWAKHKHQLNRMIMKRNHRYDLIVDNAPSIIFSPILSEYLIDIHIGNIYDVTNNKFINYKSIKQQWLFAVKEQSVVNGFDYYNSRLLANCNNKFIVPNDKRIRKLDIHYYLRFIVEVLFTIAMFIFVSAILTYISLINACPNLDPQVIVTYFMSMELLLLNYMPVIVLMLMVYLLSGRPYIAYGFTCAVVLITTIINKTKLQLRDDPFVFADVALVNESIEMTKKYTVYVTLFQVICVLLFIGFGYILYKRCRKDQLSIYLRIPLIIILGMFAFDSYNEYYLDNKLYARLGDKESIAVFSDSQQYQVRGFIYPFVRSIDQAIPRPPSNYNEKEAAEILDKFEFKDIEDNRKVNVVTIMLESYTDLRPNSTVEFNPETYAFLDNIYEESYHGNLVDNVFAGGTISTERNVINTFSNSSNLNSNVNSVAWYFKQQGYTTEAMHPCLGWFYNRKNGNRFLGYDKFLYEENAFNKDPNYVRYDDGTFFPYIKEGYNNAIKSNKKYFNFSVTYQNHGPYAGHDTADDEYIINDDSYEQLPYVITNNYLSGIKH